MKDVSRSPRGHYLEAIQLWSIVTCAKISRYKAPCPLAERVECSNEEMEYAIDVRHLAGKCDRTGYMRSYFEGLRWEMIPERWQKIVAVDIRCFKAELRHGGYRLE